MIDSSVERKWAIELKPLLEDSKSPMLAQLTVPVSVKACSHSNRAVTACSPTSMSWCKLRPASDSPHSQKINPSPPCCCKEKIERKWHNKRGYMHRRVIECTAGLQE
jgi:hypothetical protein